MGTSSVRRIPRSIARAPIGIFRLGLGGVFAGRLVMVEHRGRRSGLLRRVVLETVARRAHQVALGRRGVTWGCGDLCCR